MNLPIPSIPARIRWPMFVVALLLISITASAYTLYRANSDGGPAIVEDYYTKGKQWDTTARAKRNGSRLTVSVQVLDDTGQNSMHPVIITVTDSAGDAVTDLSGIVRGLRPHLAKPVATVPLQPVDGAPGTYRQLLPIGERGVWDFEIDGARGDTPIRTTTRLRL
jgi:hypothetical protein